MEITTLLMSFGTSFLLALAAILPILSPRLGAGVLSLVLMLLPAKLLGICILDFFERT